MDGNRPAPDLKEQYRHAVLNLPIDNPTAYLREIKRLQGLMLDMEFEQLDHDQEPEKVRKDFKKIKQNTRELRLSPACLRAVQGSENVVGEQPTTEQSTVEELAVKEIISGEPVVDEFIALTEEPSANKPATTETSAKKNKKKKKKKPAGNNPPVSEPTPNHSLMHPNAEAKALRRRITHNYLDTIRPKNTTDQNSGEYKMELIQNIANELLNVRFMVLDVMDTSDGFSARVMDEMTKLGERLANLKDGTKELMAVINELDKVRSRVIKCKRELGDVKEELIEIKLDFEDTRKELADVKSKFQDTKKELNETKAELAEVKEKDQDMEKKMNEMYAWYRKQKEVPLGHFH